LAGSLNARRCISHSRQDAAEQASRKGKSMVAVLYASQGGTLVLVPECFEPSNGLVHAYGRFRRCGRVHLLEQSATGLCERISADFDQNSYSLLDSRDAEALFGPGMPHISGDRRHQSREVQLVCRQEVPGISGSPATESPIPLRGRSWSTVAALRAWSSIRAIAARTGTPMRDFVRFTRMTASTSTAGNLRPGPCPPDAADCTTSREL
jgi:hypothetical protein